MPALNLSEAIANVETLTSTLGAADQAKIDAQAKFDTAKTKLSDTTTADDTAVTAYNAAIDDLVAAAQAAKRSVA